jgi:mannose-6-phosphate isomerase-like protein (cupin superfamily)
MPIEIVDMVKKAHELKKRKVLINTKRFHAWVHYYPNVGDKDDMHCHNADQTFYVIEGECTMHFPDGGKAVMKPGMAALITGGSFYQLENTGPGPMVLMGNRSGPSEDIQHINYELRKDIKTLTRGAERIQHGGSYFRFNFKSALYRPALGLFEIATGDLKPRIVARQPSSF